LLVLPGSFRDLIAGVQNYYNTVDRICPILGGNLLGWAQRSKLQFWICLSRRT